jgi:lysylphosphatidylglycerol synthetase-like protein (DUF2156 family)
MTLHIDHPSGFLALSPRNTRFSVEGLPGFIAYRERGRHWFALGGVHAPEPARGVLLDRFLSEAAAHGRRVIAVQVRAAQTALFRARGFRVNQFGTSFGLTLGGFSLAGTRRMKLRHKIKRAREAGLRIVELGRDWPLDADRLRAISDAWLDGKGKELDFLVGELHTDGRRIFGVVARGELCGFITYVPAFAAQAGWLHDLTRRLPDAPAGAMELCNAVAIERLRADGAAHLHFGLTPFLVDAREEPGASRLLAWALRALLRWGRAIYPARSQAEYKLKWAPDLVEREYIACRPFSLRAVFDFLRLTRSL